MSLTSYHYSPTTETARLLHTAHQITNRFYAVNGFYVLPQPPAKFIAKTVLFPDFPYSKAFWSTAKHLDISQPIHPSQNLVDELAPHLPPNPPDISQLQQTWQAAESEVLNFLQKLMTHNSQLMTLKLFPTHFGTQAAYNVIKPDSTQLEMYVRFDATLAKLVDILIDALVTQHLEQTLCASWSETHIIADWLLTQTKLKDILAKYDPTPHQPLLALLRSTQSHPELEQPSLDYLRRLGFSRTGHLLTIKDNHLYYQDQRLRNLTPKETNILKLLINQRHISTDQLADLIFDSEDDFSLYAIAKTMQRLRDKLEANNLPGSMIQTERGKGYSLRS